MRLVTTAFRAGSLEQAPGQVAQSVVESVAHLTEEPRSRVQYLVWLHTFLSSSADSRRAAVSYWRKYVLLEQRSKPAQEKYG